MCTHVSFPFSLLWIWRTLIALPGLQISVRVRCWACSPAFTNPVSLYLKPQYHPTVTGTHWRWVTDGFHHFPRCHLESLFSGGATYSDIIYRTGCSLPVGWCKEVGPGRGAAKKCTPLMWRSVNTAAGLSWLQSSGNNGVWETNPWWPYRCSNGDCLLTNLFKR